MIADVTLIAAVIAAAVAGIGGWLGGRRAGMAVAVSVVLLVASLVLAWNKDDVPGTVIEGGAAASGIMMAIGVFMLTLLLAGAGRVSRRLLSE